VAVNVTGVPAQIAPLGEAAIATDGVTFAFTVIVIVFDVAVFVLRHVPPLIVITQITWSPLASVLDE
jgi:hypothetical protein